jgi:anti-anti-sigma regulatory factor
MAEVGRIRDTEIYRNVARHEVETWPQTAAIRVDESLYFANTKYLEDVVLQMVADRPELKYLVLIGTAVNFIDASALETLESLDQELRDAGVELHLAGFKGPITDRLKAIGFIDHIGPGRVHMATGKFVTAINCIDGRAHFPVKNWLQASFDAEFVDRITEPGVDKLLAGGAADEIEDIKQQVLISVNAHNSETVAVVGHFAGPGYRSVGKFRVAGGSGHSNRG